MASLPTHMHTPRTAQVVIFVIVTVLVLAMFAVSLYEWRRTRRPLMLLMILGGLVCCLNESLVDVLGHCYFPTDGWMGQHLFGRSVPIWVDITYMTYFGAFPYLLSLLLLRGTSRRTMWLAICGFWVANLVLEVPLLGQHLYVYYGDQPFKVGDFPLWWLTLNCLGAFSGAVVLARGDAFFRGPRMLLVLGVPFATYMASWVVAMPGFWALNSNAGSAVKSLGIAASIVLGVIAIDALIRVGRMARTPETPAVEANATTESPRELQAV